MRRRITTEVEDLPEEADDAAETGPLRRCALTRERLPKERMIRFVVSPERSIVADLAGTLPGRGIWLSARGDVLETARTRGTFARAARGPVMVPADLVERVRAGLERRIVELLGLCRRAGQAVGGFDKAREWVRGGRAALILQASDGSPDECRRFVGMATVPVTAPLSAAALGAVFGRERTVHVAVAPGRLARALRDESERLSGVTGPGIEPAPERGAPRRQVAGLAGPEMQAIRSGWSRQAG